MKPQGELIVILSMLIIVIGHPGIAQAAKKNQDTESNGAQQLRIVHVLVDRVNDQLLIQGENFDNGSDPIVTLGDMALSVDVFSSDATNILADLPPGLLDGDYVLGVKTGPATPNYDEYDLTVGGGSGAGSLKTTLRSNQLIAGPVLPGGVVTVQADCIAGEVVTGGGGRLGAPYLSLTDSYPGSSTPSSWIVRYSNFNGTTTPGAFFVEAWAVCAE